MKTKFMAIVVGFVLLLCNVNTYVNAETLEVDQIRHRSNVVFVTDESGSMKQTDPADNRYEAIRLFLGEMANEGNYVGSVSFGEGLVDSSAIKLINGQKAKDALLGDISDQEYSDYTNIGCGLMEAVDMLDKNRNKELDSTIILLTDGNTDMPNSELLLESIEMKAEAIERARKAGYKIFTICLNVNGNADTSEMEQIAKATGGEFAEITSLKDLNDVETMFNKIIFNLFEDMDFSDLNLVIEEDGRVTADFEIPSIGIEEMNVLFQGKLLNCELIGPDGRYYQEGDNVSAVAGTDFLLVKVQNPIGGRWQATAYGDPDTVIGFRILSVPNFYVDGEVIAPSEIHVGDTVKVVAHIGTADGIVYDTSKYADMTAAVSIKYREEENEFPMELTADGFIYEIPIDAEGTYYIRVSAANAYMEDEEDEIALNVENLAPISPEEEITAHANIWPFIGGRASIDLSESVVDPEGQKVTYSIESTAFHEDDYSFKEEKLTVNKFSIPKGSFTIKAEDPYGAYCTFNVRFTSTNIGLIMGILTFSGIIAVIAAMFFAIRSAMDKALMGTLSVASYDKSRRYPPQIKGHGRGQISLAQFTVDLSVLPMGCRFQCDGGKCQVWFISKKPIYSDNAAGAVKKIRIYGDGAEVRICGDEKMEKGIIVTFRSDKLNLMGLRH